MRAANLALKFLLELAAFAALAYAGTLLADGAWRVVLAVALPVAAIVVWGRWCAPKAAGRLPVRYRAPVELGVFALAAAGLFGGGAIALGTVFAALVVANAVLLTAFDQWDG